MNLQERIQAFTKLGEYLKTDIYKDAEEQLHLAKVLNPWFTKENIDKAINAWNEQLKLDMLTAWLNPYKLEEVSSPKKVLIIMAGNIPLVGFHDFLTVLISGHKVVLKMSSTDNVLLKVLIEKLISIDSEFKDSIAFIDDVKKRKFDAVIATGQRTGNNATMEEINEVADATNLPVLVGSGVSADNIVQILTRASAVIVASSLKEGGVWWNPVDPVKVRKFLKAAAPALET